MSGGPDPRAALLEHLVYLKELGVREIRRAAASTAAETAAAMGKSRHLGEAAPAVAPGRSAFGPIGAAPPAPADAPASRAAGPVPPAPAALPDAGLKGRALDLLREEEIGDCRRCRLCEKRTNVVFGTGAPGARLMFVGEGPGHDEDLQGLPFVGRAGQLLTDIIKAMGFTRDRVYIANVVKCRPPENRTPEPEEIESCLGFLEKQISVIEPAVIVCLGAVATSALVGATGGITRIRGQLRAYRGIPVMPTFHPAYLLRNPAAKREVWQDMKRVMEILAGGAPS